MKLIPAGLSMQYRTRKRGALTPFPHPWCLIPYGHNVTFTVWGYGKSGRKTDRGIGECVELLQQEIGTVSK